MEWSEPAGVLTDLACRRFIGVVEVVSGLLDGDVSTGGGQLSGLIIRGSLLPSRTDPAGPVDPLEAALELESVLLAELLDG